MVKKQIRIVNEIISELNNMFEDSRQYIINRLNVRINYKKNDKVTLVP